MFWGVGVWLLLTEFVSGRSLADDIIDTCRVELASLSESRGIMPCVATVMVGDDSASRLYMRLRDMACEKAGIKSVHVELNEKISMQNLIYEIEKLNADASVHGIFVQYPLPSGLSAERIMACVDPKKDVEGFHPLNMGKTLLGIEGLVPCTPLAVIRFLEFLDVNLVGKHVVIVNHSNVVGRPLSVMFLNRNATVSIAHQYTSNLAKLCSIADILIPATGIAGLIQKDHVKSGAIVLDVGIADDGKGGVTGDVNRDSVKEVASLLSVVPGGIGPVTIACAIENILCCVKSCVDPS